MFTKQSGQIENALRGAGVPDISAKEMVQGVANCQAPLEHRGGVAFTRNPRDNSNVFPNMPPTGGTPTFYVPPSIVNRQQIINFPPWQHVPWTPIPYPEQEQWQPIPYPEWPGGQYPWDDPTVIVNGPTYMGPVHTGTVNTNVSNSTTINNAGDINNQNAFFNEGPMIVNGPINHNHNVINHQNVTNKKTVINEGDVINNAAVYNAVAYNYSVTNYGGSTTYGDVTINGDNFDVNSTTINLGDTSTTDVTIEGDTITFKGDVYWPDPSNPSGPPLGPIDSLQVNLVTDVEWDGTSLKKKYRTITLLGSQGAEQTSTVVSGSACPTSPLGGVPSHYVDMP